MKKIRIVSDGTGPGTKVFDADGTEIKGALTKVEWSIDHEKRVGCATLTYMNVDLDVVGETDG